MWFFLIQVSVNPPSWAPSVWCSWCMFLPGFTALPISPCLWGRWLAWGQQPGESWGLWQCRYHTGAHCPPWTHQQFVLRPLTAERHLRGFRPLMLTLRAFIDISLGEQKCKVIHSFWTRSRDLDLYCIWPEISTVISHQSLGLCQIQRRSHVLVLVLKWGWWYVLPSPSLNKKKIVVMLQHKCISAVFIPQLWWVFSAALQ